MRIVLSLVVLLLAAAGVVLITNTSPEPAAAPLDPPESTTTQAASTTTQAASTTTAVVPSTAAPPMLGQALALTDLDGWLQTDIAGLDDLRGQVVIVQFWTFGCYNCKNTLPYLQDIYSQYHDQGMEIVGVHSPEFEYERDPDSILAAAQDLGVVWPIALDTQRRNFHAWQGSPAYWPRTYVLDQDGLIRFDHIGEGAYDELEQTVATLLGV